MLTNLLTEFFTVLVEYKCILCMISVSSTKMGPFLCWRRWLEVGQLLFCTEIPLALWLQKVNAVCLSNSNENFVCFWFITMGKYISPVTRMVDSLKGKEKLWFTLYPLKNVCPGNLHQFRKAGCMSPSCCGLYCHLITYYTEIPINSL